MEEKNQLKNKKTTFKVIGAVSILLLILIAFLAWFFIIRDTSPATVTSDEAIDARNQTLSSCSDEGPEDVNGTWIVANDCGTFDETCLTKVCGTSFAGFRIKEELVGVGGKTVVGRTPDVKGSLIIIDETITTPEAEPLITVNMASLMTDNSARDNALKNQAIETSKFPTATFSITEPISFSNQAESLDGFETDVTGTLTIHGVSREEIITINASFNGNTILIYGELGPILLKDYDIEKPRSAVVLSVEDNALMEFQIFFKKAK